MSPWASSEAIDARLDAVEAAAGVGIPGAVGNGVADDTAAIQAVLNSVPTGGGVVSIPAGRYKITAPLLVTKDNTTIIGEGTGQALGHSQVGNGTRLEVGATFAGTAAIKVDNGSSGAGAKPVYGTRLAHFSISGGMIGSGVEGILFRSNRAHLQHVHVHEMSGNGIRFRGYDITEGGDAVNWDLYDTIVAFCQVGDCGGDGYFLDFGATDLHVTNCLAYNNLTNNVRLKAGSTQITSCHFYDATLNNILFDGHGSRTKILGCKIEGAGQHGININAASSGILIVGNGVQTNGDSVTNSYDDIIVQGGATKGLISSNMIGHRSGVANVPRYGVNLVTGVADYSVVSNVFDAASTHFGTGALNDAGTRTVTSGNGIT